MQSFEHCYRKQLSTAHHGQVTHSHVMPWLNSDTSFLGLPMYYCMSISMQLDVTYQLRLRLYGSDNHGAVISNESNVINITVLANNHPFGLFSFPHANYSVTAGYVQWCIPFT